MTPRTTDNTNFWRLVQRYIGAGVRDNCGATPMVPADAMLTIAQRIWEKRRVSR